MASASILHLDNTNFESAISSNSVPVLVDFWAAWCGPCKAIAPILDELSAELGSQVVIGKVDVDHNQELAAKFGVRAIPTLLLFKNGQIVEQMVGLKSKAELLSKIKAHS